MCLCPRPKPSLEPPVNKPGYPELINVAAEMARGTTLPSAHDEDHPRRATRTYWLGQLEQAEERAKDWAMRVRCGADKLHASNARGEQP